MDLPRAFTSPSGAPSRRIGSLAYAVLTTKLIETWPITAIGTLSHAGAVGRGLQDDLALGLLGTEQRLAAGLLDGHARRQRVAVDAAQVLQHDRQVDRLLVTGMCASRSRRAPPILPAQSTISAGVASTVMSDGSVTARASVSTG